MHTMVTDFSEVMIIERSEPLSGKALLSGAKNSVLVTLASLLLTRGISIVRNVPASDDVRCMIELLESLGAVISPVWHKHELIVDTTQVNSFEVAPHLIKKIRASVLVMGPLIARFGKAVVAIPGGDVIGARPIDYHLALFSQMGVSCEQDGDVIRAHSDTLRSGRLVLEYPSVGATENILMAAVCVSGITTIVNAALEPEVLDLIQALRSMGACIEVSAPAIITITGVSTLNPIDHTIMPDRLEAGSLLLAAAISGGNITIPNAYAYHLDIFLAKLSEMGHYVTCGSDGMGITLVATDEPLAVSFKTGPYPGFPTDLQAPMMVAQCVARGESIVEETVYENRLRHVRELQKLGAHIICENNTRVRIIGVQALKGTTVEASDIRASCALVLAGLVAHGSTVMNGVYHWRRGYDALDEKLINLGARIIMPLDNTMLSQGYQATGQLG
jgi:UDP-N-acetylglucosamine 1-carboxyvinyltransferase